jgi:serine/threonine-protein kinase
MLSGAVISDRYELEKEVGRGARGIIFKARRNDRDKVVAIKFLIEDMLNDETAFERFSTEARTASSLKHPNIIDVTDFGLTDDAVAYLVMEYLEGETLQQLLEREKRLPIRRAVNIVYQIADALSHSHSKGVIHLDIKPENIILNSKNGAPDFVKVVDFGIAKVFNPLPGVDLAKEGQCVGTPGYMSPEQAMGARHLDATSDIYSLGCLMYATIAGILPIDGNTPEQILQRHISNDPVPLSQACPGMVPANVQELVMKTLNKFPEDRYPSMDKLKADLKLLGR